MLIVGHGPSIAERDRSGEIDEHFVVRFAVKRNFEHPFAGKRVDVIVTTTTNRHMLKKDPRTRRAKELWLFHPDGTPRSGWECGLPFETPDVTRWVRLVGHKCSRGFTTVILAMEKGYREIFLHGLDNLWNGDDGAYWSTHDPFLENSFHRMSAERDVMFRAAEEYGATIRRF